MKETTKNTTPELTDIRQLGETAEEIVEALQAPEVFEAIFGEPSDEEIAAVLREARAEFDAGLYQPGQDVSDQDDDDKPYRTPTRKEILQGIKQGYLQALAGETRPIEELFDELSDC